MKGLGYGAEYRYAHDEDEAYAAGESYWPDGKAPEAYYRPSPRGLEASIGERLAHLRDLDAAAREAPSNTDSDPA
jgi:putative ATPase